MTPTTRPSGRVVAYVGDAPEDPALQVCQRLRESPVIDVVVDAAALDGDPDLFPVELPNDVDVVLIADPEYAPVAPPVIEDLVRAVRAGHDVVVPVALVSDTVKQVGPDGSVRRALHRDHLRAVQSPVALSVSALPRSGARRSTAVLLGESDYPVWTVPGSPAALPWVAARDRLLATAVAAATASEGAAG